MERFPSAFHFQPSAAKEFGVWPSRIGNQSFPGESLSTLWGAYTLWGRASFFWLCLSPTLPFRQEKVASILASQDEIQDPRRVLATRDIETLAKQVAPQRTGRWVKSSATLESPGGPSSRKQVAPSSEMFTVTLRVSDVLAPATS